MSMVLPTKEWGNMMTYVQWGGIDRIRNMGRKRAKNTRKDPLESTAHYKLHVFILWASVWAASMYCISSQHLSFWLVGKSMPCMSRAYHVPWLLIRNISNNTFYIWKVTTRRAGNRTWRTMGHHAWSLRVFITDKISISPDLFCFSLKWSNLADSPNFLISLRLFPVKAIESVVALFSFFFTKNMILHACQLAWMVRLVMWLGNGCHKTKKQFSFPSFSFLCYHSFYFGDLYSLLMYCPRTSFAAFYRFCYKQDQFNAGLQDCNTGLSLLIKCF